MSTIIPVLLFILFSAGIILAARRVCYYADYLATINNISKGIIGLLLLATITSLPELFTSLTAILTIEEGPELMAGNIFGSNCFNLIVLITAFLFYGIIPHIKSRRHLLNGLLILTFTVIIFITSLYYPFMRIGVLDLSMWLIILLFIVFLLGEKYQGKRKQPPLEESKYKRISGFKVKFIFTVLILVILSYFLTQVVDILSLRFKLGHSFGGYLFLALTTSLPEIATTFSSLKYDINLTLGNILGSNIFNPLIIAILHISLPQRNLLDQFSLSNYFAMFLSLLLLILILVYLYSPKKETVKSAFFWRVYIVTAILLFIRGSYAIYITSVS